MAGGMLFAAEAELAAPDGVGLHESTVTLDEIADQLALELQLNEC